MILIIICIIALFIVGTGFIGLGYYFLKSKNEFRNNITENTKLQLEVEFLRTRNTELSQAYERCSNDNKLLNIEIAKLNEKLLSQEYIKTSLIEWCNNIKKSVGEASETTFLRMMRENNEKLNTDNKKISGEYIEQWNKILNNISTLDSKIQNNENKVSQIVNIFKDANTTGKHAEQHLENLLNAMGFQSGIDFDTQFTSDDLRADCVLKVPNGGKIDIWIIDSKSTQSWLENDADEKIANSFEVSLKDYEKKDYANKIANKISKTENIGNIMKFMFLPFDAMLVKLSTLKPELFNREVGILSPTLLNHLLKIASVCKKEDNLSRERDKIIDSIKEFIKRFSTLIEYYQKTGESLQIACKHYANFGKSLNSRFIPHAIVVNKNLSVNAKIDKIPIFSLTQSIDVTEIEEQ